MNIERLKRWHWCLVGLTAGLFLSWMLLALSTPNLPRNMGQDDFEQALRKLPMTGHPILTDLLVRPPEHGRQLVTGRQLREVRPHQYFYFPFSFVTDLPYRAENSGQAYHSLQDRLVEANRENPSLRYRYGWWLSPMATVILCTAGATLVVGGIWPFLLNFLVRAGYGRKHEEAEYDLNRFATESGPKSPINAAAIPADAGLEERVVTAADNTFAEGETSIATPPVVPVLSNVPLEMIKPAETDTKGKEFSGEFYPTIIHVPTRSDKSDDASRKNKK